MLFAQIKCITLTVFFITLLQLFKMYKISSQRGLETVSLPTYLVTLMYLYSLPKDMPTEKGGHDYLWLESIQSLYEVDID